MQIESKRLYCRPFERADFENFYKLHKNNETSKLMGKGVISDEEIESRFNRNLKHQDGFGFSAWATFEKDTNKFVGRVGFVKIGTLVATDEDHSDKIEIGYAFLPEFWGHGYAQEIIPVFLNYGFNILKLEAIYAKTSKDNQKSQYLLRQKFHFEYVSDIMVENRVSELFIQKNTNKLHIRTATINDIASINDICKLNVFENDPDIKKGFVRHLFTYDELYNAIVSNEDYIAIVAERDNNIIAYTIACNWTQCETSLYADLVNIVKQNHLSINAKILYHWQIAKNPSIKLQVGKHLMNELFNQAIKMNYESILCQVVHEPICNQNSINFHEKIGFKKIGDISDNTYKRGVYFKTL